MGLWHGNYFVFLLHSRGTVNLKIIAHQLSIVTTLFISYHVLKLWTFWLVFPSSCLQFLPSTSLHKWFSTSLRLWRFHTVPHVVVIPEQKIIFIATLLLQFYYCYESWCKYMPFRISDMWPRELVIWPPKGVVTIRLRTTCLHCFYGFALHITHTIEIMKCLLFLYLHYFTYSLISAMLTQWHDLLIL